LVKLGDHVKNEKFMLKKIIVLLVLLSTLIAACSSAATESPAGSTSEPVVETERAAEPGTALPTQPSASPTLEADQSEVEVTESSTVNCTVVSQQPTPGPTEQSLVPPVSDEDWTLGPEDAAVTFIEYADFQ
jgi:protein-disulfide isomerase